MPGREIFAAFFLLFFLSDLRAQTISIQDEPTSAGFGQSVTLTSTVLNGSVAESGRVLFFNTYGGSTSLAAEATLDGSGNASTTLSALRVGTNSLVACWDNTGSTNPPASCPTSIQTRALPLVIYESTVTTLASSQNPVLPGTAITLTASVSSAGGGVAPDGSITFANGSSTLCSGVALSSGSATCGVTATQLISGSNFLTAAYSGDSSLEILSSTQSLTEYVQSASTVVVSSVPNPSAWGQEVTFVLTVSSSASELPTGTILILDRGQQIASSTLTGSSNKGSYLTSSLAIGSHPITAVYEGDNIHAPSAASAILTQVVESSGTQSSGDFSLTLLPSSLSVKSGGSVTTTLSLASLNSFSASLALSCSSLPIGATCSFSSTPVSLASGATQAVTLTLQTSSSSAAAQIRIFPVWLCGCLVFIRRRRMQRLRLLALLLILTIIPGCGSTGKAGTSGQSSATSIVVTAAGGGVSHTRTLTLTITP